MKIVIVTTQVPFIYGGAEFLSDSLHRKLWEFGHNAEIVKLPFKWYPPQRILEHMLAARLLKIPNADRVVALKFPAYYVQHQDIVLWLLHQFRQAYDFWGTVYQDLPNSPEGLSIRQAIINSDNRYLGAVRKIYTNSQVVSDRLMRFNGICSTVLYPPLDDPSSFRCDEFGDYIFCPGRINDAKRQLLAVEAMQYTRSPVRLVVAGQPEAKEYIDRLARLIKEKALESKVELLAQFISEQEKIDLFARALAAVYIPYDEDSYGYVTLESFQSRKPVITCSDSGGTLDVVKDGVSGFVTRPDPVDLAAAMDRMMENRARTKELGWGGYQEMLAKEISWQKVVECLTS